jgi:hypothetical protein
MWTAVALTTIMTLAPAQTSLDLKNVRTTHGIMGETRKTDKLLPGDVLVVAFDIEGLKVKEDGRVFYSMGMELTKKGKAKAEFKRDPQDLEAENSLGGTTLPAFALSVIGTDSTPGEYNLKVTVKDRLAKTEKVLNKTFEVLPLKLGFVQTRLTNSAGDPVPPVAVPGQRVYVHCALVGFKLGKDKLPNVTFEMVILDDQGKPTVPKSFKGTITTDVKATPGMMTFVPRGLDLNRSGKYKIVIKAKDNNSGDSTEQTLNLRVLKSAE